MERPPRLVLRLQPPAARVRWRVGGRRPVLLAARLALRGSQLRLGGRAAEVAFYLLGSALPLVVALGGSLGLVGRVAGAEAVRAARAYLLQLVDVVLSPSLARDLGAPLVSELLREGTGGPALAGAVVSVVVGSRAARSLLRALREGDAPVEDRHPVVVLGLSLLFTAGGVVVAAVALAALVIGPLLAGSAGGADGADGAGGVWGAVWDTARWPALLALVVLLLASLYRVGSAVPTTWRGVAPGALGATASLVVLVAAFRGWLAVAGSPQPRVDTGDEAVAAAAAVVGGVLALLVLAWLASAVVLLGGLLNEEWAPTAPAASGAGEGGGAAGQDGVRERA